MDFAGVQHDPLDGSLVGDCRVVDHRLELAVREFGDAAGRASQPQHRLRGKHDERATRTRIGLTAQEMKVRRGRRRTRHGHVVLGAQLKVALDSGGRMVRSLALVAVRQQQYHAGALAPLLLCAGDELVDDDLGTVGEVTELSFPEHERVGPFDRVAVLETHRGVLTQQGVIDPEASLVVAEIAERQPFLAVEPVVQHRVTLHKGAATGVLSGHAYGRALEQQRAERQQFAKAPIDRSAAAHLGALLEQLLKFRMHRESGWRVVVSIADGGDHGLAHRRRGWLARAVILLGSRTLEVGDRAAIRGNDRHRAGLRFVSFGKGTLEPVLEIFVGRVVLFLGDVAAADQGLDIKRANASLGLDEVVHERLGHRGVVALVVPAAAIADEVDDDIPVELLAVGEGELRHADDRLRVIAVHMEDRRLDHLGDIRGVDRCATFAGGRREADLVVDVDMNGAAGAIGAEL